MTSQIISYDDGCYIIWIDASDQINLLRDYPPMFPVHFYHYVGTEIYQSFRIHNFTSDLFIDGERQRHEIREGVPMNDTELAAVRLAMKTKGAFFTPVVMVN